MQYSSNTNFILKTFNERSHNDSRCNLCLKGTFSSQNTDGIWWQNALSADATCVSKTMLLPEQLYFCLPEQHKSCRWVHIYMSIWRLAFQMRAWMVLPSSVCECAEMVMQEWPCFTKRPWLSLNLRLMQYVPLLLGNNPSKSVLTLPS